MAMQFQPALFILRIKQVQARIGLSRSSIYARLDPKSDKYDPTFPKPIPLGNSTRPPVGWVEEEVDNWLIAQIEKSRKAA